VFGGGFEEGAAGVWGLGEGGLDEVHEEFVVEGLTWQRLVERRHWG